MTLEEGKFELGALIGEGAFGKVFECFDTNKGKRKFAMKKISLRKLSKGDRSLAETEARLLTSLQNEYILHAVTAFQENEILCIVTDFCDQGDLAQFLEERKGESLDEQRIVEWFRQICSALEYLHGKNVLHRDIKTQNIFLTGNEMTAKLGDFGVAKVLESPTQKVLSFRGSPYYMSPEIYACKPYNSKTDIWALGVCVYEMVALKLPFDAPQMQQLVYKIINDQIPSMPDGYSSELIETIKRMMCRDVNTRPSASELLQNILFKKHGASKVQRSLLSDKTTQTIFSTNEDMDKTLSDNTLRINFNDNREYDSYLSSRSTVLNTESFETSISDTELSKAIDQETSLEDSYENYSETTMTADRARSTFQQPLSSTFRIMRSWYRSLKRSFMIGGAEQHIIDGTTEFQRPHSREENERQPDERKHTDSKSLQNDGRKSYSTENTESPKNRTRFWDKDLPNEKHFYVYFWKRHSVFSQWYLCKFTVDDITYSSAEQYMMHQKAVFMDDKESARIILSRTEPSEIKKRGRRVKNFNQELWERCREDIVEKGNMAKFSQNEELRTLLFSTYPKTLVHASPLDSIWGIELSAEDKRAWNKDTWRGQNLLGEILTKVRDKLMESFDEPLVPVKKGQT